MQHFCRSDSPFARSVWKLKKHKTTETQQERACANKKGRGKTQTTRHHDPLFANNIWPGTRHTLQIVGWNGGAKKNAKWKIGSWKMCGLSPNGRSSTSMIMGERVVEVGKVYKVDKPCGSYNWSSRCQFFCFIWIKDIDRDSTSIIFSHWCLSRSICFSAQKKGTESETFASCSLVSFVWCSSSQTPSQI